MKNVDKHKMVENRIRLMEAFLNEWSNVVAENKRTYHVRKNTRIIKEVEKLGLHNFICFLNNESIITETDATTIREVLIKYGVTPDSEDKEWSNKKINSQSLKTRCIIINRIINELIEPDTMYTDRLIYSIQMDNARIDGINGLLLADTTYLNRLDLINEMNMLVIRIENNKKKLREAMATNVTPSERIRYNGYL